MKPSFADKLIIRRPLQEVFDFASNLANAPQIMDNIMKTEKLTEGPIGVGTKFKETRGIRGREADAIIEIIQFNPPESYSVRSEANGLIVTYHYSFKEVENGTEVEFQCIVKTSGIVMAVTKSLIVKILKQEDADHLKNLRRVLENEEK